MLDERLLLAAWPANNGSGLFVAGTCVGRRVNAGCEGCSELARRLVGDGRTASAIDAAGFAAAHAVAIREAADCEADVFGRVAS